jgi:hypothetical protein
MYKELFRIKDGNVAPLSAREATIKEVRTILMRDKGSPGDSDGRDKLFAYKELGAVYWLADYRSPGRMQGYEGQDLLDDAIRNFELSANWKPDSVVRNLITIYEKHVNGGIAADTLSEVAATFSLMLKTVKSIRGKLLEKLNMPRITEEELKNMISLSNELLKLASSIPKLMIDIDVAKEMLKRTEDSSEIGRGGVKITSSMTR